MAATGFVGTASMSRDEIAQRHDLGDANVMFGTDFPVLSFERMRREVEALDLPAGPKRKFLRDNAIRVYGLPITP